MKTHWSPTLRLSLSLITVLLGATLALQAEQFGLFTYTVVGGATVTITDYPNDATGPVEIPAVIAGLPITSIGDFAFRDCTGLTSVTIPSSVTSIGDVAFQDCTGLTSVTIPSSVTSIGDVAFQGCTGLTSITIPSSVATIGRFAFRVCTGLTSVSLEQGLTVMGPCMFSGCTGLTHVIIPSSVTSIGDSPFESCTKLDFISVETGNPQYASDGGVLFNAAQTTLIQYPAGRFGAYIIPSSVTSIGTGAFRGCTGLTSVTIPSSVTSIGDVAFYVCTGLVSITVPSNLTSIGAFAFTSCTALTSVSIPASVASIGQYAFLNCTGLTSVFLPQGLADIGVSMFSGCTGLTGISIPSSVTSINFGAFSGCTGLTSIALPSSIASIGSHAFSGCAGLTSVTIPSSVTSIGEYAFYRSTGLTSVTIPSSVTFIGRFAFQDCTSLTRAAFLGNAPDLVDGGQFLNTAAGFMIYYLSSRTGFTSPTWLGYPATMIDEATHPAASWLLAHELWFDTGLDQDPNGDGVDLFLAYALDLDPRIDLRSSLPVPVLDGNTLSLGFPRHESLALPIVRKQVPTWNVWTTNGVTQSAPGADGRSTATVPLGDAQRFLRLAVEE